MNLLYVCKLSDSKLQEKLSPVLQSSYVTHIYVLRDIPGENFSDKVTYLCPTETTGILRHIIKIIKGVTYCKKYNINVIAGVLNTPHGYIGSVISLFSRLPFIHVMIAGHREFWIDGILAEVFNCWLFKRANCIMVTGRQTRNYLLNKGFNAKRIAILPNIPDEIFLKLVNIPSSGDREYDIVFISRIDKNKNLALLLNALLSIRVRCSVRVLIVGDGDGLNNMRLLASTLGIDDMVTFAGYVSGVNNKIKIYTNSKIFVSCSKGEGFPVSLLEAMCSGCIPVVSNVGDIVDVIEQGVNGYVFNDTDSSCELADYLLKLLTNGAKIELMNQEAQKIKTKISVEKNTQIWNDVLSKVIKGK